MEEMLRADREEQDSLHLEELVQADREKQEQQDRMVALRLQESITQEEMAKRRGQHGRNRGRRGFSYHNTGHRSRGMGRSQNRERSHQETVDHELTMSLQGQEDQRGGSGDERVEASPSMFPLLAQRPAGFLQDDHQMQHEWSRPFQDIQQEMAASQQEFQPFHQFPLQDLDEEELEFENHHRRLSQMGTSEDFDRILSMLNEPGLSNVGNSYEALLELGENLGTVTSGLSWEECSTLPTARYTQRDKNTAECSVCLETNDKYRRSRACSITLAILDIIIINTVIVWASVSGLTL